MQKKKQGKRGRKTAKQVEEENGTPQLDRERQKNDRPCTRSKFQMSGQ